MEIDKRQGAYLPHWTREGATYFVTYRTADSLPREAVERLRSEARLLDRKAQWQELSAEELIRREVLRSEAYQQLLDNCHGACVLRRPDCAQVVANSLAYFDGKRYGLWAWCVMPNHVHVVVQPAVGFELAVILKVWKSYTSREISKVVGMRGAFWQPEYYDHLIRDRAEFDHYVRYTLVNPVAAGLREWKWVGARTGLEQWHG